jgi:hypothetical protein
VARGAIPVFVVRLVSLPGIAINVTATKPRERVTLPAPLRLISHYPWPVVDPAPASSLTTL